MSIQQEKTVLRTTIKGRLKELALLKSIHQDQSILTSQRFMELEELQQTETVLCFVSYGTEIDTTPLIENLLISGRKIALPRTVGDTMTFHLLPSEASAENWQQFLEPGDFGILTPSENALLFDPVTSKTPVLCVLPGLAFDAAGNRLGKGKGFYDRYLSEHPDLITVGYAFDLQVLPSVPAEAADIRCKTIVTDLQVIRCRN